jgi:hypothetical protein
MVLTITDCILTLKIVGRGAVELNPVTAYFISLGNESFILGKLSLTCFSAMILLKYVGQRRAIINTIFTVAVLTFMAIVTYQTIMMVLP